MITLPASIIPSTFIASDALNQPQPKPRQLNYQPYGHAVEQYPVASDRRRRRELNRLAKLPQPYAPLPEYGDWPAEQYEPTPMSLRLREPIVSVSDWNAFPYDIEARIYGIAAYDGFGIAIYRKSAYAIPSKAQLDYNRTVTALSSVLALPAPGQTTFGSWTSNKQIKAIKRTLSSTVKDTPTNAGEAFAAKVHAYTGKPQTGHDNHYRNMMLTAQGGL